ncbi:MAG TPA: hypothetical protein VJA44_09085 [Acidimicrobiia bacterium]|nr:hypothetical protein [Acidimicrobiia bacterium]
MKRLVPIVAVLLAVAACGDDGAATTTTAAAAPTTTSSSDAGRVAAGPAVTVEEALASTLDRPILEKGYLFVNADGSMVLADLVLESFPPQPGGATVAVVGFDGEGMTGLRTAPEGSPISQWVEGEIEILGTVGGAVLTVYDNPSA